MNLILTDSRRFKVWQRVLPASWGAAAVRGFVLQSSHRRWKKIFVCIKRHAVCTAACWAWNQSWRGENPTVAECWVLAVQVGKPTLTEVWWENGLKPGEVQETDSDGSCHGNSLKWLTVCCWAWTQPKQLHEMLLKNISRFGTDASNLQQIFPLNYVISANSVWNHHVSIFTSGLYSDL